MAIPPTLLTDAEVIKTLSDMEETIRYRLRMTEIFPVEMSQHHIGEFKVLAIYRPSLHSFTSGWPCPF